jgi:hypothetical protein
LSGPDGHRRRRRYWSLAAGALLVAVIAAAALVVLRRDDQPGRDATLGSETTTTTIAPTSTSSSVVAATTGQPAVLDVHTVDWNNLVVPGEACLTTGQIQLHETVTADGRHFGTALVPDEQHGTPDPAGTGTGPKYDRLDTAIVTYGDVDGDGGDEALLALGCSNNGGTADGALLYSLALYSGSTGSLRYVGLITPQQQPSDARPTLLHDPEISSGRIVVQENWYGPTDSTCCPSGTATTTWTYSTEQLRVQTTHVTAEPNS